MPEMGGKPLKKEKRKMNKTPAPWLRFIEGPDGAHAPAHSDSKQEAPTESSTSGEDSAGADNAAEEPDYKAKYEAMKTHSREWEAKAKANLAAAKKLKEIEDSEKTELEKLTTRLEKEKAANAAAQAQLARYRIAAECGISAEDAELFLHGDEDAMKAQAKILAQRGSGQRKAEDPNQGRGTGTNTKAAAEAWAKSLFK